MRLGSHVDGMVVGSSLLYSIAVGLLFQFTMVRQHVIIADSRGRHLQTYISNTNSPYAQHIRVEFYPGALYENLVDIALDRADSNPDTVYYVLGGTNNFSERTTNGSAHRFVFVERSAEELTEYMIGLINRSNKEFLRLHKATFFVLCPITGVDIKRNLNDYNPLHQEAINATIVEVNQRIIDINDTRGIPTPWTASYIHHRRRHYTAHLYHKLGTDGLHPSQGLYEYWADQFVKYAEKLSV